jgi:hypothetical protein
MKECRDKWKDTETHERTRRQIKWKNTETNDKKEKEEEKNE